MRWLRTVWCEEEGQDVIEYTLLIAFVALVTIVLFGFGNKSIAGIVSTSNSQIVYANDFAHST